MKFRKKPIVIEACQFTGKELYVFNHAIEGQEMFCVPFSVHEDRKGRHLIIQTLEGNHRADPGDWIVRGVRGEFYPVKPDIFAATYEPV